MSPDPEVADVQSARREFVDWLYKLHQSINGGNEFAQQQARARLAVLRRCFSGPVREAYAYQIIYDLNPPLGEEKVWLEVAGLYALSPQPRPAPGRYARTIGRAMGELARERGEDAVLRRFVHLVSVDGPALHHYLRQSIQLLRTKGITYDIARLLDDLTVLMNPDPRGWLADRRQQIRLAWSRDYHYAKSSGPNSPPEPSSEPTPTT